MNALTQTQTQTSLVAPVIATPVHLQRVVPYLGNLSSDARMAALHALADGAGLRLPDTRLPEGTALLPVGEEARRALKAQLAQLPELAAALDAYEASLRAESPVDVAVPVQRTRMAAHNGGLYAEGKRAANALGYTHDGFAQVAGFVKPATIRNGFAENILALPNELRAQVFNHWAQSSVRSEDVTLRTFIGGSGARIVRAVTSARHSLETGDDLALVQALRNLQRGAKVRVTREPGGRLSEVEVIWPMLDRELRVGDVAHGGIRITNSETKAASVRVEAFVLRVLCYNFTTAFSDDMEADDLVLRHVGDLTRRLPNLVTRAMARIDPLVQAFGDAFKDPMPQALRTRGEALERVRKTYQLPETTVALAAQLWDADGSASAGDTRAGLVNALTRASQEQDSASAGQTERVAGRIIIDGWDALLA